MSMMPFDIVGPIMQSPSQASDVAKTEDAARNRQSGTTAEQAKVREVTENAIGTADEDMEVNSDSMGAGSRGRAFRDTADEAEEPSDDTGVTKDEEGRYHLDIEA